MGAKVVYRACVVCAGAWGRDAPWRTRPAVLTTRSCGLAGAIGCRAATASAWSAGSRALMLAALAIALCAGMSGIASARERPPSLQVTIVPEYGKPIVPPGISDETILENTTQPRDPNESGMTVARLLALVGVAPKRLVSIAVTRRAEELPHTLLGEEAINGSPVLRDENEEAISFIWPPKVAGEAPQVHELLGVQFKPLAVTLNVEGGLLEVSPIEFSPFEPDAGELVSFVEPRVQSLVRHGGAVTNLHYSWQFGDGESSALKDPPPHRFEPPEGSHKGPFPYTVELVVTGTISVEGREESAAGSALKSVSVLVTKEPEPEPKPGEGPGPDEGNAPKPPGTGPPSANPNGPPSGSVNTPSNGVEPSRSSKTSHKAGLSFGGGSGGSGHSGGKGSGSSGSGDAKRSDSGSGKAAAGAPANVAQSKQIDAQRQPASPHAEISRGLVGVLLTADGGRLPAAILASDTSPAQPSTASLPDAAPGSPGDGGPIGLLRWALGILAVVIIVSAGGLAELQPRARYRRLAGG
jgi:hypothetical protein